MLNAKILGECNNVRDDTNHKLALQVAENKRMQSQLCVPRLRGVLPRRDTAPHACTAPRHCATCCTAPRRIAALYSGF